MPIPVAIAFLKRDPTIFESTECREWQGEYLLSFDCDKSIASEDISVLLVRNGRKNRPVRIVNHLPRCKCNPGMDASGTVIDNTSL